MRQRRQQHMAADGGAPVSSLVVELGSSVLSADDITVKQATQGIDLGHKSGYTGDNDSVWLGEAGDLGGALSELVWAVKSART